MSPQNAVLFMQEAIAVVVLIDLDVAKKLFQEEAIHCTWLMDGTHSMQICLDPDDLMKGAYRISECLFQRISTEFLSLSWFVQERSRIFDLDRRPAIELANLAPEEIITSPPTGWTSARDCYD
ncbi:hypothetical protein [Pseudomonas fluorescens]|uniref:Uncharacterized protein n=1 Tax=Pseudomonas fluorescens TaxID=294 RepID=A0A5E7BIP2_PSEFL|nr:hypothetical protein [Pseudomonas fluorescens]VVN91766.1 hypothetical protein PS691_01922 [Pseudomonas fluorescens]